MRRAQNKRSGATVVSVAHIVTSQPTLFPSAARPAHLTGRAVVSALVMAAALAGTIAAMRAVEAAGEAACARARVRVVYGGVPEHYLAHDPCQEWDRLSPWPP